MNKSAVSILVSVFLLLVFTCSIIGFVYTYNYADTLKWELENRDRLIESLNHKDSIMQNMLNERYSIDSIAREKSVISSGELVRYANELSKENSELFGTINSLNDSLSYYKIYYGYNQRAFNHKYTVVRNASGGRNFSFEPNAVPKDLYSKCKEENSVKSKEIFELSTELTRYKRVLDWYKIDINNTSRKGDIQYPGPYYAPTLDSALMLLPVYREKLKYDKNKKQWSVGNKMTISFIESETITGSVDISGNDSILKNEK
ncbi:MAG: hypothetical protein VB024_10775 [Dysgonamonadaceae bacterium]|jgi:hypothetical protein|nr:hypothetical protein [Dysgonamonadaceae bacterium]HBN05027.1 hypothetical protein [Bacteroidales bacterium]